MIVLLTFLSKDTRWSEYWVTVSAGNPLFLPKVGSSQISKWLPINMSAPKLPIVFLWSISHPTHHFLYLPTTMLDFPFWRWGTVVVKEGDRTWIQQFPVELMEAFPAWPALRKNCLLRHVLMAGRDKLRVGPEKMYKPVRKIQRNEG